MTPPSLLSVIVPAHQAAALLSDTLGAIRACEPSGTDWELIMVDDGSDDGTAELGAALADRVVRLRGPAAGPAAARNAGAGVARGDWLLFVDADVRVHPDLLVRFRDSIVAHPRASAIFGTYDDSPAAPGLVSRYRNLLHRYVHLRGAGPAETFWAGLGGVRADAFRAAGGFDSVRYPRPQIEDIELGYRLRDGGAEIILDAAMQGTHLKGWGLGRMMVTDFRDRAMPWMRLLLERRGRNRGSLNVGRAERVRVMAAGLALAALAAALGLRDPRPAWLALGLLAAVAATNVALYRWLTRRGGLGFTLAAIPLHLLYYVSNAVAGVLALLFHWRSRPEYPSPFSRLEGSLAVTGLPETSELPALGFAPLHKRAFGIATGTVAALVTFVATAVYLLRDPQSGLDLGLLSQFFLGYSVSWRGALIGAGQAWIAGFVMGWFLAFSRNLALTVMVFIGRSRAELEQTRDFLDHL
jgi:glycosyltransferase involved in cell wall biosynthesis